MRRLLRRFTPYTVEHTYAGFPLKVRIADPLAGGWYDRDWGPLPEIDLLCRRGLEAGARVFDLGAHQGVVAMILARHVGPAGQVVAVEALPHNAAALRGNRELNGLNQLVVEEAAVADRPGVLEVCLDLNSRVKNSATDIGTIAVHAVTVDDLTRRYGPPDTLFIDIEGYECHALRGAAQTLSRAPACFVEVHLGCGLEQAGGSVPELCEFFPDALFDRVAWTLHDHTPRPVGTPRDCPHERFFLLATPRGRGAAAESPAGSSEVSRWNSCSV
jgi:FkbM family methyltransferase